MDTLEQMLDTDTVQQVAFVAYGHECSQLKAKVLDFIEKNFHLLRRHFFTGAPFSCVKDVVGISRLRCSGELDVLNTITKWAACNYDEVEYDATELTDCIRLERLGSHELQAAVKLCSHPHLNSFRDTCVDRILNGNLANFRETRLVFRTVRGLAFKETDPCFR